jgi:hypothetical protein
MRVNELHRPGEGEDCGYEIADGGLTPEETRLLRASTGADTPELDDALCGLLNDYSSRAIVRRLANLQQDHAVQMQRRRDGTA